MSRIAAASEAAPAVAVRATRPRRIAALALLALGIVALGAAAAGYKIKQDRKSNARAVALTGGDPNKAPALIIQYGCAGCHQVPGVRGPGGKVGPPLADVKSRIYLGGRLINTPDNLIAWIEDPRKIDPKTAMPTAGVSKAQARDIAAYLLAL